LQISNSKVQIPDPQPSIFESEIWNLESEVASNLHDLYSTIDPQCVYKYVKMVRDDLPNEEMSGYEYPTESQG
jgi:hypothetical protein